MQPMVGLFMLAMIALGSGAAVAQPSQRDVAAVAVPAGNGAPVVTDGIFEPGEWDDALRIAADESVALYLKEYRGVVFIGVRSKNSGDLGPSELSLAVPGGAIQKLHVSAQLYEVVLPATGPEPPPRFGFTSGWYANELRRDMELSARLEKEGKGPMEIIRATSYPSDGIEFAIRRSKLPGERWLMRLRATGFFGGRPGALVYPPASAERTTDGWLELRLGSESAPAAIDNIADSERAAVEQTVRDAIGWALTKDRSRLESIMAHDAGFFIFHPDSKSTVRGYEAFAKMIPVFMDPRFKATHFEVKELVTNYSGSGAVAWYSAMLEDCGEWEGKPSCWKDTRWTGVLEKRDGRWVIVQMHFSFANDAVLRDCPNAPADAIAAALLPRTGP